MISGKTAAQILLGFLFALSFFTQLSTAEANDGSILYDLYPFVRVYKNGTVQRFIGKETVPAGVDLTTGVHSKDVKFSQRFNLAARLYFPGNAIGTKKLPILIYYHGGGFFAESAFAPTYHHYLNYLVGKARVIAVSVNYRLAPEYPLPTAYQDSWLALKWTISHFKGGPGTEPWLSKYADFQRIYIGGDSAGGNIAHNMAIRIGINNPNPNPGVNFQGMFLNCPFFATKTSPVAITALWVHAYPNSRNGLDNPLVNPGLDPNLKHLGVKKVFVFVAGNDPLRASNLDYEKKLAGSGWKGKLTDAQFPGEGHVFNLNQPNSSDAKKMNDATATFLNSSS